MNVVVERGRRCPEGGTAGIAAGIGGAEIGITADVDGTRTLGTGTFDVEGADCTVMAIVYRQCQPMVVNVTLTYLICIPFNHSFRSEATNARSFVLRFLVFIQDVVHGAVLFFWMKFILLITTERLLRLWKTRDQLLSHVVSSSSPHSSC